MLTAGCGRSHDPSLVQTAGGGRGGSAGTSGSGGTSGSSGSGAGKPVVGDVPPLDPGPASHCTLTETRVAWETSFGEFRSPALAWNGAGYGVAWSTNSGIRFVPLDANGTPGVEVFVTPMRQYPSLVGDGDGFLLVLESYGVRAIRMDAMGKPLGLEPPDDYLGRPWRSVAATEAAVFVGWRDCPGNERGSVVRLDRTSLTPSSTPLFVNDGGCMPNESDPAVAAGDGTVGVAWVERLEYVPQVWFATLGGDGALVTPPTRLTNSVRAARGVRIARAGDAYVLAWSEDPPVDDAVHLLWVSPSGVPLGAEVRFAGSVQELVTMDAELGVLFRQPFEDDARVYSPLLLARFDLAGRHISTELVLEAKAGIAPTVRALWADAALRLSWIPADDDPAQETGVHFGTFSCDDFGAKPASGAAPIATPGEHDLGDVPEVVPCVAEAPAFDASEPLVSVACLAPPGAETNVLQGDVLVETPAELEALRGVTAVAGSLSIYEHGSEPLDDFTPLSELRHVGGDLEIVGTKVVSLAALSALEGVGRHLVLDRNYLLPNVDGLERLACVGGDVEIAGGAPLTSLAGLSGLRQIGGDLSLRTLACTDLRGLENLSHVGGDLRLSSVTLLRDVSALSALSVLGGRLVLENLPLETLAGLEGLTKLGGFYVQDTSLTNLDALARVTEISGDLHVAYNHALESVDGLASVALIGGSVYFIDQPLLTRFGLDSLENVGRAFTISNHPTLVDLDPLSGLRSIGGTLHLEGFRSGGFFQDLGGLANLERLGGSLELYAAGPAAVCFSSLECVGGGIYLTTGVDAGCLTTLERVGAGLAVREGSVTSLEGLGSLGSVGGTLEIVGTTALSDLAGLEALRHVAGSLYIDGNAALGDIDALLGLTRIGGSLTVSENPLLPTCAAENVSTVPVVRGSIAISENGPCEP